MNNNRVLSRMGARELTPEELEVIAGSAGGPPVCTLACTFTPAYGGKSVACDSECPKP